MIKSGDFLSPRTKTVYDFWQRHMIAIFGMLLIQPDYHA